jgi:hypothetical protein
LAGGNRIHRLGLKKYFRLSVRTLRWPRRKKILLSLLYPSVLVLLVELVVQLTTYELHDKFLPM